MFGRTKRERALLQAIYKCTIAWMRVAPAGDDPMPAGLDQALKAAADAQVPAELVAATVFRAAFDAGTPTVVMN